MDYSNGISKAVFKFVKNPAARWKLMHDFPTVFFLPHMKPEEYDLFKELCRGRQTFLEYGSGGSTIYLLKNKKNIFSVESNPEFYSFMNSIQTVSRSIGSNLTYQFVDLGPTNKWGKPISSASSLSWPYYYTKIWDDISTSQLKVDAVFIDGRFRVCCCLYSILKVREHNWKDTVFIIHDFWRRKQYHGILKFLDEVKSARNLAAFKVRDDVNTDEIKAMLQEYALVVQ